MTISSPNLHPASGSRFAVRLKDVFRQNGWRVDEEVRVADRHADMVVSKMGGVT